MNDLPFGQHEDDVALSAGMMKAARMLLDVYGRELNTSRLTFVLQKDRSRQAALMAAIEDVTIAEAEREMVAKNARLLLNTYNEGFASPLSDRLGGEC